MIREPGGRLVAEARELSALLAEREAQLERLTEEIAANGELGHPKHSKLLATARWSVQVLRERLNTSDREEKPT